MKKISKKMKEKIEKEVKSMLHAHRDTLRNRVFWKKDEDGNLPPGHNPLNIRFSINEGFYGEAFGVMRALQVLGYGEFESSNLPGRKGITDSNLSDAG